MAKSSANTTAPSGKNKISYLKLFLAFAKVGVMTFGGGYAMLPIIQRELVDKRKWVDENEIMDYYAIGQCTPGVIAVNTATFTGRKIAGTFGGIAASLGVVFPSVIIITIIAALIRNFASLQPVQDALAGIRVCVCVLILNATVKMFRKAVTDWITLTMFIIILAAAVLFDISPVLMVLAAGAAGIVIRGRKKPEQDASDETVSGEISSEKKASVESEKIDSKEAK